MRQNPYSHCLADASYPTTLPAALDSTTVVHVLDIDCPVARLHDFMSDARQWLPQTIPALQSVQPLPFGQWLLKTRRNLLKLRLYPATAPNEFLYEMVVPGLGSCQVHMQLGATPIGCQVRLTLHKHQQLPLPAFATSVRNTFSGLQTLKLVLEQD